MKLYLLCGAPGSGKSTWGKEFVRNNPNVVRVCPDEFRAILGKNENDQSVSAKAFEATREEAKKTFADGKNVIIDATNMYRKSRKQFLDIAKNYNAEKVAIVFKEDKKTLLERNKKRGEEGGRNVPEEIIQKMLDKFEHPDLNEFDHIICIKN